jgi:cell division protein FtsQ
VLPFPRARVRRALPDSPAIRAVAAAACVVVAAAGAYLLARNTPMFAVNEVAVTGAPPDVAAQVRSALGYVEGQSLLALDAGAAVDTLERLPTVFSATYDRDFPHTLRVRVVPERPVAVLRRGADSWTVSARGRVIAPTERGGLPSLPRIWLRPTTLVRVGWQLHDHGGVVASRALASFRSAGLAGRVSYLKADEGRLVAGLRTGLEVRFGAPVDLKLKLAVVQEILPLLALPGAGGPRYLDVAVPERPVAGTNPQVES